MRPIIRFHYFKYLFELLFLHFLIFTVSTITREHLISIMERKVSSNHNLYRQFSKFGSLPRKSDIISSHQHLSSNFFNQFHLKNCRRFSTSSRLSLNNEETTKSEKKSDKNDNEYIHMHHKTKGFVGYHTPKPKTWKKHKEKDYDIMMTLAIAVLGGFALYSIGARSARAE